MLNQRGQALNRSWGKIIREPGHWVILFVSGKAGLTGLFQMIMVPEYLIDATPPPTWGIKTLTGMKYGNIRMDKRKKEKRNRKS